MFGRKKGPWPDAPVADRVLMLCAAHEEGWGLEYVSETLRLSKGEVRRVLLALVDDEWLIGDHPLGEPSEESLYRANRARPGLGERLALLHVEYGYVPDDGEGRHRDELYLEEADRAALVAALAEPVGRLPRLAAARYRQLRARAVDQENRRDDIWRVMDAAWSDTRSERAREMLHVEPGEPMRLPPPTPASDDCREELLLLAIACRQEARSVASKFWYLASAHALALQRLEAMHAGGHGWRNALSAMTPPPGGSGLLLRAGAVTAAVDDRLREMWPWASESYAGTGGDLALAYTYRDIARHLEAIVEAITQMPGVANFGAGSPAAQLLGVAVEVGAPDVPARIVELEALEAPLADPGELGDPVVGVPASELRTGQWIVGVGDQLLTEPVAIIAEKGDAVALAVVGAWDANVVPRCLLEDDAGLTVRGAGGGELTL